MGTAIRGGDKAEVFVESNGAQVAKMVFHQDGSQQLLVSDKWDYWTISCGNYQGQVNRSKKVSGTIYLRLSRRDLQ